MNFKKWARLFLAVAPFLAGCEGFWDVPSGSGSGGGGGTASGVFYVLNQKTAEVAGFSLRGGFHVAHQAVTNSPYRAAGRAICRARHLAQRRIPVREHRGRHLCVTA